MNWFGVLKIDSQPTSILYTLLTQPSLATKSFISEFMPLIVQKIERGSSDTEIVNNLVEFYVPNFLPNFPPVMDVFEELDLAIAHIDYEKLRKPIQHIVSQIRAKVEQQ